MPAINIKIVNGNDMTEPSNSAQFQVDTTNSNTNGGYIASTSSDPAFIKMKQATCDAPDTASVDNSLDFSKGMVIKKV